MLLGEGAMFGFIGIVALLLLNVRETTLYKVTLGPVNG